MSTRLYYEDIICSRATPAGASAIAVIRVSGKNCWSVLKQIFYPVQNVSTYKPYRFYYGDIKNQTALIDQVIVLTYSNYHSFTGEESFEINCHGSEIIIALIIKLLISHQVRLADPGEFSKRAFLNGKMDLAEAESIMDLVHASSQKSALIALRQLSGHLSCEINQIKEPLVNLLAAIEVNIDYPEEDLEMDTGRWGTEINRLISQMTILLQDFNRGRYYREGINAVILGKTNAGKSTFFNFLLNEDKAIVSDIHGTTRDYIDGIINIEGYGIRIYDTAGLRDSLDPIEMEGTRRAIDLTQKVDLILYLISAPDGVTKEDEINLSRIDKNKKIIIIFNKIDLLSPDAFISIAKMQKILYSISPDYKFVEISALKKAGIEMFNRIFLQLVNPQQILENNDPLITNERHAVLLKNAEQNLTQALLKLDEGLLDIAAFELREALDRLGEITGEVTPRDIIERIFSTFCVGK